jgi:hypothetical protein
MPATPNFFYVLDDAFAGFLELGLRAIRCFHPQAQVVAYDVSGEPSPRLRALATADSAFTVVPWPESQWMPVAWADRVDFDYFHPHWSLRDELKYRSRRLRTRFSGSARDGWIVDKAAWLATQRRKIRIWAQKAACAADCLANTSGDWIFLDADAMPWRSLGTVFDEEFDVALTLRRLADVKLGLDPGVRMDAPLPYHAVNAGVMFFRGGGAAQDFIGAWTAAMARIPYHMVEQTALSLLCLEADAHAFERYRAPLQLADGTRLLLLPCEEFNNTYIDDELRFDANSAVVHFKGYLHQRRYFAALERLVAERIRQAQDTKTKED